MAKPQTRYVCQSCGAVSPKWLGQCGDCNAWNSFQAEAQIKPSDSHLGLRTGGRTIPLEPLSSDAAPPPRRATGLAEFDRALGGGLVRGSAVLIGGDPGIGKSTLLLQSAAAVARDGGRVVYLSGEEAADQVRLRARRMGLSDAPVVLGAGTALRDILATLQHGPSPDMVIIDSIQTLYSDQIEAAPGTVSQVRVCAHELIRYAKTSGAAVVLVGHVTKDGQIAGPRVMEHMVDTVLYFEGDRAHPFRILRAVKNRFGGTDEIGVFEMADVGLIEVSNPSALFLSRRAEPVPGAVVFAGMEGTRPLLVEIQALVVRLPSGATPRRAVVGWDSSRLAMVLAVLEARCGLAFGSCEVYLNVAGGLRVSEPAADLAVAAALVSALADKPLPVDVVAFGEIALSGEVRPVSQSLGRLKEAAKLGFGAALCAGSPQTAGTAPEIRVQALPTVGSLVDRILHAS